MKMKEVVLMVLVSPLVTAGLVAFLVSNWSGYICGLLYGVLEEIWREFADQFRMGRGHMTGDGENHR